MRLTFPDEGSRLVYRASGSALGKASGDVALIYSDANATTLADIQTLAGTTIVGSSIAVDADSLLPLFLGPDDVDTLYVSVAEGTLSPVYSRTDDRLDALTDRVEALEGSTAESGQLPTYTTSDRPTATAATAGGVYYDLTLSLPVYSDGTSWRDAAGTVVADPPPPEGDVTATQVFTDTFDTYATGNLPSTTWTLNPNTGIWRADATDDVAWANGSACNAIQNTGSRDHRIMAHVKVGGPSVPSVSGVILRYKNATNYISFEYVWTSTESAWSFFILANNVGREVKFNTDTPLAADQNHTFMVDAFGDEITVFIDDVEWSHSPIALTTGEATALDYTATWAGMINFSGRGNFYDVTGYTLEAS